jgi:hypothetical protein
MKLIVRLLLPAATALVTVSDMPQTTNGTKATAREARALPAEK